MVWDQSFCGSRSRETRSQQHGSIVRCTRCPVLYEATQVQTEIDPLQPVVFRRTTLVLASRRWPSFHPAVPTFDPNRDSFSWFQASNNPRDIATLPRYLIFERSIPRSIAVAATSLRLANRRACGRTRGSCRLASSSAKRTKTIGSGTRAGVSFSLARKLAHLSIIAFPCTGYD